MAHKRSDRLKPVSRFNENQEQKAANDFGKAQRELDFAVERLQQLEIYREDYARQFIEAGAGKGWNAIRAQDYQLFLQNLDKAAGQQKAAIEQLRMTAEFKKRQWLAARNKTQAIQTVVDRYQLQETREAEKKEQKEQDDRSSIRFHRNKSSS